MAGAALGRSCHCRLGHEVAPVASAAWGRRGNRPRLAQEAGTSSPPPGAREVKRGHPHATLCWKRTRTQLTRKDAFAARDPSLRPVRRGPWRDCDPGGLCVRPRPRERGSERCGPRAHQAPRAGPETQNRGAHHGRTGGETGPTHALGRRSALGARTPRPPRRCGWSFGVTAKETSRGRTHPDGAAGRRLRSRLGSEAEGAAGRGRACSGDRARPVAGGSAGHGAGHGARGAKVLIAAESAPEPG